MPAPRGISDDYSDIELNLWVERFPTVDEARNWLLSVGAEEIGPELMVNEIDGSRWLTCRVGGIWIEAGWATVAAYCVAPWPLFALPDSWTGMCN